jgi:hypothetical protein
MKLVDFHSDLIKGKLRQEGKDGFGAMTLVDFVFSDAVQDVTKYFDNKFDSPVGAEAYPRSLLLLILLFCYNEGETKISRMVKMCRTNRIVKILACGKTPSYATIKSFIKDCNTKAFKRIFLYTLVELNDLGFLKFLHLFIDGTDALIRGSKYYKITRKELKALKLLKKHGLLLKNKKISQKSWQKKIKRKINENTDKNSIELLNISLNNPYKFTRRMAREIPAFEEAFMGTDKDFICVIFPQATLMPTKKGGYGFAFNLQQIMNENNIVMGSVLLKNPNDYHALEDVILDLRENFQILKEMIREYGSRNNLKEIQRLLDEAIFIMDAGYFSDFNLQKADEYEINALIMPKTVAIKRNYEFRKRNGIVILEDEDRSFKKKDFQREYNRYICPTGQIIELTETKEINSITIMEKEIPESWMKRSYVHMSNCCSSCTLKEKCIGDKDIKIIIDNVSQLSYEMCNKFTNNRYLKIYSNRFQVSESINGYFKTQDGVLLLSGSDENEISNEMHLRNAVYNLKRKIKLKDTLY